MAEYKLLYVNYRGRAEAIRFILAHAGVQFDDLRHIEPEQWTEYRPNTPLGIIPTLETSDGKVISGNSAISRYLAEKYDLAGGSPIERAEVAQLIDVTEEVWSRIASFFLATDEKIKDEAKQTFKLKYLPLTLQKLEAFALANNCPEGWMYGTTVTYADFAIYVLLEALLTEAPTIIDPFPRLALLKSSVEQLPNIAKWLQTRPKTKF